MIELDVSVKLTGVWWTKVQDIWSQASFELLNVFKGTMQRELVETGLKWQVIEKLQNTS